MRWVKWQESSCCLGKVGRCLQGKKVQACEAENRKYENTLRAREAERSLSVCVLQINRYFYSSTYSTPAVRTDSSS